MAVQNAIVLIPAFNEADQIGKIVASAARFLPVVVVDDGSTDNTVIQAEKQGALVLRQYPNQGKGAALRTGFRYCLNQTLDFVITLDADGQHDPSEIPLFVKKFTHSYSGLIIGNRDFSRMPFARRTANTLGRIIISRSLGQEISDNQSGYRLISMPLAEKLIDSSENGFEFEVEMLALCLKHNLGLDWIPIQTIYADEKSHIRPVHHILQYFRIVRLARRILHG